MWWPPHPVIRLAILANLYVSDSPSAEATLLSGAMGVILRRYNL